MKKKRTGIQTNDVLSVKRSETDRKLDPVNVAESKRARWEQQKSKE